MSKGTDMPACYDKHKRIPVLKTHQIFPIERKPVADKNHEKCEDHKEVFEYVCTQCEKPLCAACVCDPQHEEHCEKIVNFKFGMSEMKKTMKKLHDKFKVNAKDVEVCAKMVKRDMDSLKECKKFLSAKFKDVETIHDKIKRQLNIVTELEPTVTTAYKGIIVHLADVHKQMKLMNGLSQLSDVALAQISREYSSKCDCIMNDTQQILNSKITVLQSTKQDIEIVGDVDLKTKEVSLREKLKSNPQPGASLAGEIQSKSTTLEEARPSSRQARNLKNNLQFILEIKQEGPVYMKDPSEIISVGDGTVILLDYELDCIQRLYPKGNIVRQYNIALNNEVKYKSACVYGGYLFVATSDNVITKLPLDGTGSSAKYRPGVNIDYIHVSGDNFILICDWGNFGLLEYNIMSKQVKYIEKVECGGMWYPEKVSVVHAGDNTKHIVTGYWGCDIYVVNIYDKTWNVICSIHSGMDIVYGLTVTSDSKLLIAYGTRIHEYSLNGSFIRDITDKKVFHSIADISYSGQYLWVLERCPNGIKIFTLK